VKVSTQYKELLKRKFRFAKATWESSDGTLYIGYNHKVKPSDNFEKNITKKEATLLFNKDILVIEKFLNRNLNKKIPQKHFDIMVSLCYDVGTKAVKNSLFFNYYLVGDEYSAFKNYMTWCTDKRRNLCRRCHKGFERQQRICISFPDAGNVAQPLHIAPQ
jgi:GH24 family phage-related lysozyme (muramidase)